SALAGMVWPRPVRKITTCEPGLAGLDAEFTGQSELTTARMSRFCGRTPTVQELDVCPLYCTCTTALAKPSNSNGAMHSIWLAWAVTRGAGTPLKVTCTLPLEVASVPAAVSLSPAWFADRCRGRESRRSRREPPETP